MMYVSYSGLQMCISACNQNIFQELKGVDCSDVISSLIGYQKMSIIQELIIGLSHVSCVLA